jgi:hypothetical protein
VQVSGFFEKLVFVKDRRAKEARRRDGSPCLRPSRDDCLTLRFELAHHGRPMNVMDEIAASRLQVHPLLVHAATGMSVPDEDWPDNMKFRSEEGTIWMVAPGLQVAQQQAAFPSSPSSPSSSSLSSLSSSSSSSSPLPAYATDSTFEMLIKPGLTSYMGKSKLFRIALVALAPDQQTVLAWTMSSAFLVCSSTLPLQESYETEVDRLNLAFPSGYSSADFTIPPTHAEVVARRRHVNALFSSATTFVSDAHKSASAVLAHAASASPASSSSSSSSSSLSAQLFASSISGPSLLPADEAVRIFADKTTVFTLPNGRRARVSARSGAAGADAMIKAVFEREFLRLRHMKDTLHTLDSSMHLELPAILDASALIAASTDAALATKLAVTSPRAASAKLKASSSPNAAAASSSAAASSITTSAIAASAASVASGRASATMSFDDDDMDNAFFDGYQMPRSRTSSLQLPGLSIGASWLSSSTSSSAVLSSIHGHVPPGLGLASDLSPASQNPSAISALMGATDPQNLSQSTGSSSSFGGWQA